MKLNIEGADKRLIASIRVHPWAEQVLPQLLVGLHAEVSLTQHNETRYVEDGVWVDILDLQPAVEEQPSHEGVQGDLEATLIGGEHDHLAISRHRSITFLLHPPTESNFRWKEPLPLQGLDMAPRDLTLG